MRIIPKDQEDLFLKHKLIARELAMGRAFKRKHTKDGENALFMRCKPISFLLASTVVGDIINRGDIFIVNLATGVLFSIKGDTEVEYFDAYISIP